MDTIDLLLKSIREYCQECKDLEGDCQYIAAQELANMIMELDDALVAGNPLPKSWSIEPSKEVNLLRDYRYVASNPYRTDSDDILLLKWKKELSSLGLDPNYTPVERMVFERRYLESEK